MPILFQTVPGRVARLDDAAVQCESRLMNVENPKLGFPTERSIITRMTLSEQANVQFLHTLGAQVFIYVFGDRIGQMGLSGLSFACDCGDEATDLHGAQLMYQWYKKHRVAKRRSPVRVMLGTIPIEGFLTAFNFDVVDPSIKLVQWSTTMATLPDEGDDEDEPDTTGPVFRDITPIVAPPTANPQPGAPPGNPGQIVPPLPPFVLPPGFKL